MMPALLVLSTMMNHCIFELAKYCVNEKNWDCLALHYKELSPECRTDLGEKIISTGLLKTGYEIIIMENCTVTKPIVIKNTLLYMNRCLLRGKKYISSEDLIDATNSLVIVKNSRFDGNGDDLLDLDASWSVVDRCVFTGAGLRDGPDTYAAAVAADLKSRVTITRSSFFDNDVDLISKGGSLIVIDKVPGGVVKTREVGKRNPSGVGRIRVKRKH